LIFQEKLMLLNSLRNYNSFIQYDFHGHEKSFHSMEYENIVKTLNDCIYSNKNQQRYMQHYINKVLA
jgi:hypothetical protein